MQKYIDQINNAKTLDEIDSIRIELMGKRGVLTEQLKNLSALPESERKSAGSELNKLRDQITTTLDEKRATLEHAAIMAGLEPQKIDVTLPASTSNTNGKLHPLTHSMMEATTIMSSLGFKLCHGPDIEDDFHNFTALNTPLHHPARDMQDTFFLDADHMMRTQTSAIQIRAMEQLGTPIRVFGLGRNYRREIDATHTPMFHQMEGLHIGTNITMADMIGTIKTFIEKYFDLSDVPMRIRPSYFPFTEPSVEVDIRWDKKSGVLGSGNDWLEIAGAGMVHPNVLRSVNVDSDKFQGYAFGFGWDRMTMLKYGIPDIRNFFRGDIRWLNHYGFDISSTPSLIEGLDD